MPQTWVEQHVHEVRSQNQTVNLLISVTLGFVKTWYDLAASQDSAWPGDGNSGSVLGCGGAASSLLC